MLIANPKYAGAPGFQFEPDVPVDVPDAFAAELLAIKDAGFYVPEVKQVTQPAKVQAEVDPATTKSEVAPEAPAKPAAPAAKAAAPAGK